MAQCVRQASATCMQRDATGVPPRRVVTGKKIVQPVKEEAHWTEEQAASGHWSKLERDGAPGGSGRIRDVGVVVVKEGSPENRRESQRNDDDDHGHSQGRAQGIETAFPTGARAAPRIKESQKA